MELNIEAFNPKKEELLTLVDQYSGLTINGIEDKAGYNVVSTARKNLKTKRVEISKAGKEMRDEANKFSKLVIETEKGYISIIEPLEEKLQTIEDEYLELLKIEHRKEDLPARQAQLQGLSEMSDDEILKLDDGAFDGVVLELKQAKLQRDFEELEAEKAKIVEEERKKKELEDQQRKIEEAKEQARIEAEQKAQKEIDQLKADAEAEKLKQEKEKTDAEAKIKVEAEQARIEAEKLRKNTEYKKFLSDNGYNELTDKIEKEGNSIILYRTIATIML